MTWQGKYLAQCLIHPQLVSFRKSPDKFVITYRLRTYRLERNAWTST